MADFVHSGWSLAIIVVTLLSILACVWLAWAVASKRSPVAPDGSVGTTGHVWDDDLEELNNPLPRWWLYLFYGTCAFALLYLAMYPGLGTMKGLFGWTSAGQYDGEVEVARAVYEPLFATYLDEDIEVLAQDATVVAMGERLYLTYCTQCHGSDARGARSFPNLADDDWLGPAEAEHVKNTVINGRQAVMPAMAAAVGNTDEAVDAVAHYVLSLSGSDHDAALAEAGQAKFAVCAGCHGADGAGNPAVGAPNLTDDTWLYGGSLASVQGAIRNGFSNQMPAFGDLLGEGKAHVVAAYVWSLSNGGPRDEADVSDASTVQDLPEGD